MLHLTLINASLWLNYTDNRYQYFFTGALTSFDHSCATVYRPFAWLRFDTLNGEIIGARDHFGLEPFFYCIVDNKFIFGSTIPDILKHLEAKPSVTGYCKQDILSSINKNDPPYSRETYYKGIYRVTPGNMFSINDGVVKEEFFWKITPNVNYLRYKDEAEYYEEFCYLLTTAIKDLTSGYSNIGAECSGGLDSSSILIACKNTGIFPKLFTNKLPSGWYNIDEQSNIELILNTYKWHELHQYVDSSEFEPIETFKECAKIFAGPPPYWLGMLNTPILKQVSQQNIPILLSGFAGDECFSLRCPLFFGIKESLNFLGAKSILADFIRYSNNGIFKQKIMNSLLFLAHSNHSLHKIGAKICNALSVVDPRFKTYNKFDFHETLKSYQYSVLQGKLSHELRMKIEYDAILAKYYNFKFVYPLLYPPLVNFCLSLPPNILRSQGQMALLARKFINNSLPEFSHNTKTGPFVAITARKCNYYMDNGLFDDLFLDLPFADEFEHLPESEEKLFIYVRAYMLKYYCTQGHKV